MDDLHARVRRTRIAVLLAGILSLIVTVGIARFSYTPMLPLMLAQTDLDTAAGGWLAAFNYAGYLCGALLAATIGDLQIKDRLYRAFLVLAVVTTLAMPLTEQFWLWVLLRFLSGLSSAGGMLIASGLILNWLIRHHFRSELGIHFLGLGGGIAFCSLSVMLMLQWDWSWGQQWQGFGVLALLLAIPAWRWMPRPDTRPLTIHGGALVDRPPQPLFQRLLLLAYFCAGWGYVISATFIVDIVERQPALSGNGPLAFLLVGIAGIPAVLVWDRVARLTGYMPALLLAYLVQILGIVLPALTDSLTGALLSAWLFGGTFIGCVSLVLTLAGRFFPTKPARLMGRMTLAYGAAQIIAPALTGMLAARSGNYDLGLFIATGVMLAGALVILLLWRLEQQEPALARGGRD